LVIVLLHIKPLPKPTEEVGTLVRASVGAYAVLAERAVILPPAIIDEQVAVLQIQLLFPFSIVE
jgi:hypothetical protein